MEELFPALPFPEKLMLLPKHLQKEREILGYTNIRQNRLYKNVGRYKEESFIKESIHQKYITIIKI